VRDSLLILSRIGRMSCRWNRVDDVDLECSANLVVKIVKNLEWNFDIEARCEEVKVVIWF